MKQTSDKWYGQLLLSKNIKILSPEGWDRDNFDFSWHKEEITKEEFVERTLLSITTNDKNIFKVLKV